MTYSYTEKFTLVPDHMANPDYLKQIFEIGPDETVQNLPLEQYKAVLYFAATTPDDVPLIYGLLQQLGNIDEYNKLVAGYSKDNGIVYIAAAQGEKLLLANSYKAADFTTAFYFISLATQQVMFNPHLTQIYIHGQINQENENLLNTYYKGVGSCAL